MNSALKKSFLSDISEKEEGNSLLYESTPNKIRKEITLSKITPNKSSGSHQSAKLTEKVRPNSDRKPLSSRYDSCTKSRDSNDGVYISIHDTGDDGDHGTISSVPAENTKQSTLLEALAQQTDSEDAIMFQLNDQLKNRPTDVRNDQTGFEILEINNGTDSPSRNTSSQVPRTPVKQTQSDSKVARNMRQLNFDMEDFEPNFNPDIRRRNRRQDENSCEKHEVSLGSLEVSKITEDRGKRSQNSSEGDHTITISPPALKDRSKGSEYDRTSKELGLDTNSPSDDFEINEQDLDEN